ncbi:MAG: class I SAM-dependent methyltransferase [Defluviitaleaceae bacterium]|nr:class I SAM-dependent methyltransferase [Defluviitaleaceae bacterium]
MRLTAILNCIDKCETLADIGTDHAYLPIEAINAGLCERAIACDIGIGPLKMADFNIQTAGLQNRIETRLGDGLAPLQEGEADCIVIAGMGGMRILEILSAEPNKAKNAKLILQPQHDLEELRRFLHANKYNIIEEKLAWERSRFYVIMVARFLSSTENEIAPWTDAEYFLGKIANAQPYYQEMHKKITGYIDSINDETAHALAKKRLKWLEEGMNGYSRVDS